MRMRLVDRIWPVILTVVFGLVSANAQIASGTTSSLGRVAYGNGFVAVGDGGITVTSPDGFNWTVHSPGTNGALAGLTYGLAYDGRNFVAVGNTSSNATVQFSPDGVVWSQPVTFPSAALNAVIYSNSVYVVVGQSGTNGLVITSLDGSNWMTQILTNAAPLQAITFGRGVYVATGDAGIIATSADVVNWTPQMVLTNASIGWVLYGNGIFVAASGLVSTNGVDWIARHLTPSGSGPRAAYGKGYFESLTTASMHGIYWYSLGVRPLRLTPAPLDITYGAGRFVIVGEQGSIGVQFPPDYSITGGVGTNGEFGLTVTGGALYQAYRVQGTTDLSSTNWVDLFSYTNGSVAVNFTDNEATNYTHRFYRVWLMSPW